MRGKKVEAAVALVSIIPILDVAFVSGKLISKTIRMADKTTDLLKGSRGILKTTQTTFDAMKTVDRIEH